MSTYIGFAVVALGPAVVLFALLVLADWYVKRTHRRRSR